MEKIYLNREKREAKQRDVVTFLFQSIQVRERKSTFVYGGSWKEAE
jgi:hypothetical protein